MKEGRRGEYKPKETATAYKRYAWSEHRAKQDRRKKMNAGPHEIIHDLCTVPNK